MDGTIADLYSVDNWLADLRSEKPTPYIKAPPLWDMRELDAVLRKLQENQIKICVITWLSKNSSEAYKAITRQAKRIWLEKYNFPFDFFHGIQYGTTKANSIRKYLNADEEAILIDDDAGVREGWTLGKTIDPTQENIIEILKAYL